MSTKPVIKAKTAANPSSVAPSGTGAATATGVSATAAVPSQAKEGAKVVKTTNQVPGTQVRQSRVPPRQEYIEPEDHQEDYEQDEEDYEGYDENGGEYDMEQMEAMREYESQRMAEVFTQVLATVFTYENITLPETILTLSQALDTHNKTQEGILAALNKIADKLSKN